VHRNSYAPSSLGYSGGSPESCGDTAAEEEQAVEVLGLLAN
jgi:hypothetical protein